MNALPQHFTLHEVSGRLADVCRHNDQLRGSSDDLALRDNDAITSGAIPNSGHPIPGILSDNGIYVENWYAKRSKTVADAHRNPLCTKGNHPDSSIASVTLIRCGNASCRNAQIIQDFDASITRNQIGSFNAGRVG